MTVQSTHLERGSHPLGVRPLGDALANSSIESAMAIRQSGLGHLAQVEDGLLLQILAELDAASLAKCGRASKFFYALARDEDLWRRHVLSSEEKRSLRIIDGSWKRTFVHSKLAPGESNLATNSELPLRLQNVFSDVLFHSWYCASAGIDPQWLVGDDVERMPIEDMTEELFIRRFERPNRPVVLKNWRPLEGGNWSRQWLMSQGSGVQPFNAGGYKFTFSDYFEYLDSAVDDQPLYLFDKDFARDTSELGNAYYAPQLFGEDLFSLLPDSIRPDWRWLIIGGRRSGSSFHKDPNETSAWNGIIRGSKRWLMLPAAAGPPPGVQPSEDGGSVIAPLSPMEWFLNFFEQIVENPQLVKCTTVAEEVLYVPRGWWHCVINLEETVAITQNFVTARTLPYVLKLLREYPGHLSGVSTSAEKFEEEFYNVLRDRRPDMLEEAEQFLSERSLWTRLKKRPKLQSSDNPSSASDKFSFGFFSGGT